jgi:CRP-like cAMP-binding protein
MDTPGMKNFFNSLGILQPNDLHTFDSLIRRDTLTKGEFMVREGEVVKKLVFIRSGILRSYFTKPTGDEVTYCLTFTQNLMTALSSFIEGNPSQEYIQTLTPVELEVINKEDFNRLTEDNIRWLKVSKLLMEQQFLELEKRVFSLQKLDATTRYRELVQKHSHLVREIPLKYLASYLNITPRHLSRIRASVH